MNIQPSCDKNFRLHLAPFLKWAGGKRWLVASHQELLPDCYNHYYEPFLGSGAVFFHMRPNKGVLSDMNKELVETYNAIKKDWCLVHTELKKHHKNHCKDYYYKIRSSAPRKPHTKAAKFIYLNRTCWNGLYRVNLRGEFNVPIGTKSKVIMDSDNFELASNRLKDMEIVHGDFEFTINKAQANDFVFIDPPYTVKHNYNGFIKYNENLFSWSDQIRLRDAVLRAIKRNVKVLVLNADHESIHELYDGIGEMFSLDRMSIISGKSTARGRFSEVAIKCYA